MKNPVKCSTSDCCRMAHAKGLCKCCYMQLWNHGKITPLASREAEKILREKALTAEDSEYNRIARDAQLAMARQAYQCAVGVAVRMLWRRRIRELGG